MRRLCDPPRAVSDDLLQGLPPILGPEPRVLILGSMPSVASLEAQQYYGHPRNAFWTILGALVGAGPELDYAERIAVLQRCGIVLWDVIGRCRRDGSLDAAIRDVEVNDLDGLLRRHPTIRAVFLNGGTAYDLFRRHVARPRPELLEGRSVTRLPSTSPAHAARSPAQKLEAWRAVAIALAADA